MSDTFAGIPDDAGKSLRALAHIKSARGTTALIDALSADIAEANDTETRKSLVKCAVSLIKTEAERNAIRAKFAGRGKIVAARTEFDVWDKERKEANSSQTSNRTLQLPERVYLDESNNVPVLTTEKNGREILAIEQIISGGELGTFFIIEKIRPRTSQMQFGVAVRVVNPSFKSEGSAKIFDVPTDAVIIEPTYARPEALRYIVKCSPKPVVCFVGTIEVLRKFREYDINMMRTLDLRENSRNIAVRTTSMMGDVSEANLPLMNLRTTGDRSAWLDRLDLLTSSQPSLLKTVILALTDASRDDSMTIVDQGPAYLNDGTLIFAAKSGVFDEHGTERTEIHTDIVKRITAANLRYYDVTPFSKLNEDQIKRGITELQLALTECPEYPEIPAAFAGQVYTSQVVTLDITKWSGIEMPGISGSGKTFYALRWDAVQSSTLRSNIGKISPVLPLGDDNGTKNGYQYRSRDFAGYALTTDDVIKEGDTEFKIREQTQKVQNLVRSVIGGAPKARVDHVNNAVVSATPPQLLSSIKITTEVPLTGNSLRNRLIALPYIPHKWGSAKGAFNREIARKLSSPESIDDQHAAWSAYCVYLLTHHARLTELHNEAIRLVESWELGASREANSYGIVIAGHLMFAEFAATYGIDYSEDVTRSVSALRKCLTRQIGEAVPMAQRFAEAVRSKIVTKEIAFPGPPKFDPDGTQTAPITPPWIEGPEVTGEDGITRKTREMGGFIYDELGIVITEHGTVKTSNNGVVLGYLISPTERAKGGRKAADPLTEKLSAKWRIVCTDEQFKALCERLSRGSYNFLPGDVITSLRNSEVGTRVELRGIAHPDKRRYITIDAEFILKTPEGDD